ncbi:D-alanine--D-alanine ligase family protein [Hyphococcus sp.]|jgi:D-alanine-D-alanine ligase|uniref:D-alanine--D-alanine ligase family protein n=1 Tax=Hyphococcus sp. TaxID=2038636 RepID=UPI003D0ED88B
MPGFIPVIHGRAVADRPDEADTLANAQVIAHALERLGYVSDIIEIDLDLTAVEKLANRRPRAAFNLVEGIRGDGALGHVVCAAMDHFGVPYTGAKTEAYLVSSSKLLSKAALLAAGLPSPKHWLREAPAGEGKVIVKSVSEHASFGMDQKSIVESGLAAAEIAAREEKFGGKFFAEQYIPGREFNIAVLETNDGPRVLPMAEMAFDGLPPGVAPIIDYAAKWDEESPSYHLMTRRFGIEEQEPQLAAKLRALTLDCWHAGGLSGYARVDFRVDERGEPYILEFNANPCLAPDAGFAAALDRASMAYEEGVSAIVNAALAA